MANPEREDIWLTNLKFTRQGQIEEVDENEPTKDTSEKHSSAALLQGQGAVPKTFTQSDTTKSNPYDRLASDKPGEELTADSTIWKLYVTEAKEHDEDLVLAKNRNLDMMLVFAALFSAILTSFLLDSKNMMQQDSAETTNFLLMQMAQRLNDPNGPAPSLDMPTFEPSSSARWINGLWFTSLVFSLSAALIAMLAKEWLDTFVRFRPRPAHDFTLIRQARLDALYSWGALHIIDYLPLFLHISLLMFSLGMVVYLYTAIDSTVATVVALTTGATAFFYVITNLLSVLYEVCPFGTQISHSTRRILKFIANHWTYAQRWKHLFVIKRSRSPHQTTEQELHALRWLAGHAQDPLVGDSAYHALAGFRSDSSPSNNSNAVLSPRDSAADPNAETPSPNSRDKAAITPGRKEKLITHMFVDVCQRMREEPTSGAHELEVSCGASVARFAATLPRLVNYLQPHSDRKLLIKLANERRRHLDLKPERFDPPKQALEALDAILDNTCPPFTADAYARITASELRLVTHIAGSLKSTRNSQPPMEWDSKSYQTRRNSNAVETAIGILTGVDPKHNSEVDIFELQARYSRSLARASFQMFFHSNDRASMSPFSLIGLLESLDKAAKCDDLNGTTRDGPNPTKQQLCTHHPQNSTAPTKLPDFNIFLVGAGDSYELRSGEIGNPCGLIAGILNVLGASSTRNVAAIEVAAANALNSVAPLLIRQLFGFTPTFTVAVEEPTSPKTDSIAVDDKMNKTSQYGIAGATATPSREIAAVPRSPGAPGSPLSRPPLAGASFRWDLNSYGWPIRDPIFSIAHWSLGQMIVLATFAKKHREVQGIGELSRLSLRAFNYRFQSCFPRSTAFTIAATYLRELKYLIDNFDTVDSNSSNSTDTESANAHLLQILALKEEKTVYSTYLADELGGPSQLLKIMQAALAPPATVEILLADISDAALSYWPYFSDPKDVDDQGLLRLLKLAEHQPYKLAVARCIFQIVRTAATLTAEHPGYPSITIDGLPAFFEATRFVLNYHESNPKKPLEMYNFVDNMFKVVRAFGSEHDEFIKNSIPRKEVKGFLKTMTKNTRLKTEVRNDWKRFGKPDDDDNQDEHTDPDHSKRKAVPDQRNVSEGHDQ